MMTFALPYTHTHIWNEEVGCIPTYNQIECNQSTIIITFQTDKFFV